MKIYEDFFDDVEIDIEDESLNNELLTDDYDNVLTYVIKNQYIGEQSVNKWLTNISNRFKYILDNIFERVSDVELYSGQDEISISNIDQIIDRRVFNLMVRTKGKITVNEYFKLLTVLLKTLNTSDPILIICKYNKEHDNYLYYSGFDDQNKVNMMDYMSISGTSDIFKPRTHNNVEIILKPKQILKFAEKINKNNLPFLTYVSRVTSTDCQEVAKDVIIPKDFLNSSLSDAILNLEFKDRARIEMVTYDWGRARYVPIYSKQEAIEKLADNSDVTNICAKEMLELLNKTSHKANVYIFSSMNDTYVFFTFKDIYDLTYISHSCNEQIPKDYAINLTFNLSFKAMTPEIHKYIVEYIKFCYNIGISESMVRKMLFNVPEKTKIKNEMIKEIYE